jgi:hypothetical protein
MKYQYFLVLSVLVFGGCATTDAPRMAFEATASSEVSDVSVTVTGIEASNVVTYSQPEKFGALKKATMVTQPSSLLITVENQTDLPIVINWDRSSVNGENVVASGRRFADAGRSGQPLAIAPGYKVSRSLTSADQLTFNSAVGWSRGYWAIRPLVLVLCIDVAGQEKFVVQTIKLK